MATRSSITAKHSDGTFKSICCHFDGYLSHNGKILNENYTTQEQVDALVAPGDISCLGSTPEKGCTIYYGRDRGERREVWA